MTTKKAILVQLAVFAALLPCIMVVNESGDFSYNVFGFIYAVSLVFFVCCTSAGRKAVRAAENANKVLFGGMYGD